MVSKYPNKNVQFIDTQTGDLHCMFAVAADADQLLLPRRRARAALLAGRHRGPPIHAAAGAGAEARRLAGCQGSQSRVARSDCVPFCKFICLVDQSMSDSNASEYLFPYTLL